MIFKELFILRSLKALLKRNGTIQGVIDTMLILNQGAHCCEMRSTVS